MEVFKDMKKNTAAKAELWADRIRDFQDSGLSYKEWCQKHEIAFSTFHYWFRKLQAGSQAETSCDNPVFAKLPSEQEIHSAALLDHPPVTIFLSETVRVEIAAGCPECLMASLLHVLMGYA